MHYKNLNTAQRRALDRFVRSYDFESPASQWPEINSEAIKALVDAELLEERGRDDAGERLYRVTDGGISVHDEMWKDGKVPSHPSTDPFDPSSLD